MNWILSWIVLAVLVGMSPRGAGAIVDPTPDLFGVYFDPFGDHPEVIYDGAPVMAYFLLTMPSAPVISEYEFSFGLDMYGGSPDLVVRTENIYPPNTVVISEADADPLHGEVVVRWLEPVPTSMTIVLMNFRVRLFADLNVLITVGPVAEESIPDGLPSYRNGEIVYPMTSPYCHGHINEPCGVAVETRSFGTIKALYR